MRDVLTVLVVAVVVLLLGWLGYLALFADAPQAQLRVNFVSGSVLRVGETSVPALVGDVLGLEETLVAGEGGQALLSFGDGGALRVEPGSTIRVLPSSDKGLRIELEGGRVQATVREGDPLGVVSGGREVRAESGAQFTVAREQDNTYVASQEGELSLIGFGDVDRLRPEQVLIAPDSGPSRVDPSDRALLLEVDWPQDAVSVRTLPVQGSADPGSRVTLYLGGEQQEVQLAQTVADRDGQWRARIELKEGDNLLRVELVDPLGRTRSVEQLVNLDTTPPQLTVEVAVSGG